MLPRLLHGHSHYGLSAKEYHLKQHLKQDCGSHQNDEDGMQSEDEVDDEVNVEAEGHTHIVEVNVEAEVQGPGFLSKCCPKLFSVVDSAWKMYPIGFLFGLGFDTASEVGLLALAALAPREHIPAAVVMLLPLLFSIGMALIDTLDGILMLWAYGWAEIDPRTKLCFNLYLTLASAFIAIGVGVIEVLGCVELELHPRGAFWNYIGIINDHFQWVGVGIIAFFIVSSLVTVLAFKFCFD